MNQDEKINFWMVVRDCLIIIHKLDLPTVTRIVREYVENFGNVEEIYDEEPFWVACSIVDNDANIASWLTAYLLILQTNQMF